MSSNLTNSSKITRAYFILDRSGSMISCLDDTIKGFNDFISDQQKNSNNFTLSLTIFDDVIEDIYQNLSIDKVPLLTKETYQPRNFTSLCDAIGKTIHEIENTVNDNSQILIIILTDGKDNTSKEFKSQDIHKMISQKQLQGWQFLFLGANQDAIHSGEMLGINHDCSITFDSHLTTPNVFRAVSGAVRRSRETGDIGFNNSDRQSTSTIHQIPTGENPSPMYFKR